MYSNKLPMARVHHDNESTVKSNYTATSMSAAELVPETSRPTEAPVDVSLLKEIARKSLVDALNSVRFHSRSYRFWSLKMPRSMERRHSC
jgi:hypothetical protein